VPGVLAEAPRCSLHPEWPVLGTCPRCGKFICDKCLSEGELLELPKSGKCPECEKREPPPQPLGGWLLLVALHVTIGVPSGLLSLLKEDAALLRDADRTYYAPILVQLVFTMGQLIFTGVAGFAFFGRKRAAVRLMMTFYFLNILAVLVGEGVSRWSDVIAGRATIADVQDLTRVELALSCGLSLLWVVYFAVSKRVKATFVVP
jgi:hypothetical protein